MKGKNAKGIKTECGGAPQLRRRRTLRLTDYEDARLAEQAALAGLTLSEYLRRRLWGGRPILSQTDASMIRELRRLGGLLKHNFTALRQAGAGSELLQRQEELLEQTARFMDCIGEEKLERRYDRQEGEIFRQTKAQGVADR